VKIVTRAAPTISGELHLGTLYNALLNYIYAKRYGGRFLLRLDGTALTGPGRRWMQNIENDLIAFGLVPDLVIRQSDRVELYNEKVRELLKIDKAYYCDCTVSDIIQRLLRESGDSSFTSIERPEKYPPPGSIRRIRVFALESEDDIALDSEVSASGSARDHPPSSVIQECDFWQPVDVGFQGLMDYYVQFRWSKPYWIRGIEITWKDYPFRGYRVLAGRQTLRVIAKISKFDQYCYPPNPGTVYVPATTESLSFAPVHADFLMIQASETMKETRREYVYDRHCRALGKKLSLLDMSTVVRIRGGENFDAAIYLNRAPNLALASPFDDQVCGVSHLIRGRDIRVFASRLEKPVADQIGYMPRNMYHGLVVDDRNVKFSKFVKSPPAVALLGAAKKEEVLTSLARSAGIIPIDSRTLALDELIERIDFDKAFEARDFQYELRT
jgi:hypothetical protein